MRAPTVLICTVGTGDIDKLRESLFIPLTKSIRAGEWQRVVLLPSLTTAPNAERLREEINDAPIEIKPLPRAGIEDDADGCFAHFNSVIGELRAASFTPEQILVDFTRGTKAMSAALVLAAVRHDLPRLRYISGERRDARGMVVPGAEQINDFHTRSAIACHRLDLARRLFECGDFAAVLTIVPGTDAPARSDWPAEQASEADDARNLATFYAAWDRLDYRSAAIQAVERPATGLWGHYIPSGEAIGWVRNLAAGPPQDAIARADWLRLLAVDLFANGERRLRDHHYEDAVIRAYRTLELIGQLRLCAQGIHSDDVPPDHPVVETFQRDLIKKKGSRPLECDHKGRLYASREQVARLLKRFKDPLAERLIALGTEGAVSASRRNYSALIHGFEAAAGSDPQPLRALYQKLECLLHDDGGDQVSQRLALARAIDFSVSHGGSSVSSQCIDGALADATTPFLKH